MAPPRRWRGELLDCTGENTDADCKQSCEVTFCPCFGFADNYRRAFRSWYIPHFVVFIICTSIWFWVSVGGYAECQPLKVPLPRSPPGMPLGRYYNATELALAANASTASGANVLLAQMTAYNSAIDTARLQNNSWQACNRKFNAAIAGTLALLVALLLYGGARRAQMRRKFGLPGARDGTANAACGNDFHDVCTWLWCSWAALCQETRTLRQNGVRDGVWAAAAADDKAALLAPGAVEMNAKGGAPSGLNAV